MVTVDVVMKMPLIEGFEYTGEYRKLRTGELYYSPVYKRVDKAAGDMLTLEQAIMREAKVWKKLTLEKALEMGKSRKKFTFRHYPYALPVAPMSFSDTVDYIDLNPGTRNNVRLGYYGWGCASDIEYLEE